MLRKLAKVLKHGSLLFDIYRTNCCWPPDSGQPTCTKPLPSYMLPQSVPSQAGLLRRHLHPYRATISSSQLIITRRTNSCIRNCCSSQCQSTRNSLTSMTLTHSPHSCQSSPKTRPTSYKECLHTVCGNTSHTWTPLSTACGHTALKISEWEWVSVSSHHHYSQRRSSLLSLFILRWLVSR